MPSAVPDAVRPAAGRRLQLGLAAAWLCACGEPEQAAPPLLVDHARWELVADPTRDPFAEARARPAVHACESGSYFEVRPNWFEIELARCRQRYITVAQPSLHALEVGDRLEFPFSHLLLRPLSLETLEAYVALALDGRVVWERTIPIAVAAHEYDITVAVPAELPAGTAVALHIDNHGENSYDIGPIRILRAP